MQQPKTRNFKLRKIDPPSSHHDQRQKTNPDKSSKLLNIINEVLLRFRQSEDYNGLQYKGSEPSNKGAMNESLVISSKNDPSKKMKKEHEGRLDVRDKIIQIPFQFHFNADYVSLFKNGQGKFCETELMDQIIIKIQEYLVGMVETIVSISFNELLQGKLKENESKDYASKNILLNVHEICKQTYKSLKQHNLMREEQKQVQILLVESIQISLKEILYNLAPYYPQASPSGVTPKMRQCLLAIDRSDNNEVDFLATQNIKLEKQDSGNYTGYIMTVINRAIQVTGEVDDQSERGLTMFEQFTQFIQNLSWIIKEDSYSKIVNSVQEMMKKTSSNSDQKGKNRYTSKQIQVGQKKMSHEDVKDRVKQFFQTSKLENVIALLNQGHKQQWISQQKREKKIIDMRKNHEFQIGQKLPNRLKPFNQKDIKSNHFTAKHSSILRILTKWAQKLQDIFDFAESYIKESHYPFVTIQGKSLYPSEVLKDKLCEQIINLKSKKDDIKRQLLKKNKEIQSQFLTSDINNLDQVSRFIKRYTQTRITASKMNALIVELMKEYVSQLIKLLLEAGKYTNAQNNQTQYINLITFRIGDLMRARLYLNQSSFIKLFKTLYLLDQRQKRQQPFFQLIRIKNKLDTKDNNILINLLFKGKVQCQIQVLTQKISGKSENYYTYSHYLYQMMRGSFGVLSQCAIIIAQHDPIASVNTDDLYYYPQKKSKKVKKQVTMSDQKQEEINEIFICEKCKRLVHNEDINFYSLKIKNICQLCIKKSIQKKDLKSLHLSQQQPSPTKQTKNNNNLSIESFLNNIHADTILDLVDNEKIKRISNYSQMHTIKTLMLIFSIDKKKNQVIFNLVFYDDIELQWYSILLTKQLVQNQKIDEDQIQIVHISKKIVGKKQVEELTYLQTTNNKANMVEILKLFKVFSSSINLLDKICIIQQKIKSMINIKSIEKVFKNKNQVIAFNKNKMQLQYINSAIEDPKDVHHIQYLYAEGLALQAIPFWLEHTHSIKLLNLNNNALNNVTSLYKLKNLKEVYIRQNAVSAIFLKNWSKLQTLDAGHNNLATFCDYEMKKLKDLNLQSNELSEINLSFFPSLVELNLNNNSLSQFQISNLSANIHILKLENNNLSAENFTKFPDSLKELYLKGNTYITQIKNEILPKNLIILNLQSCQLQSLSISNLVKLKSLHLNCNYSLSDLRIKNVPALRLMDIQSCCVSTLENIQFPKEIEDILCDGNKLEQIQLSNLSKLNYLAIPRNKIKKLKLKNVNLEKLNIEHNEITSLQEIDIPDTLCQLFAMNNQLQKCTLKDYPNLTILQLEYNELTELDIANTPSLKQLAVSFNKFTNCQSLFLPNHIQKIFLKGNLLDSVFLQNMPKLSIINIDSNPIKKVCLKNMPMLHQVSMLYTQITVIQDFQIPHTVARLFLSNNQISSADFINWKNLRTLVMQTNILTKTTFQNLPSLVQFWMDSNELEEITFKNVPKIQTISLTSNKLTKINYKQLPYLKKFNVQNNELKEVDFSQMPLVVEINASNNALQSIFIKNLPLLTTLNLQNNLLVKVQLQNLPKLVSIQLDDNKIEEIKVEFIKNLKNLYLHRNPVKEISIKELKSLQRLIFSQSKMPFLKLQKLPSLIYLQSSSGQLTSIDLSDMPCLESITFTNHKITKFTFQNLPKLQIINFSNNQLQDINLQPFSQTLTLLNLSNNKLKDTFSISNFSKLYQMHIENNQIEKVVLNNLQELYNLSMENNLISQFQFDGIDKVSILNIAKCPLQAIDLSKFLKLTSFRAQETSLKEIQFINIINLCTITLFQCPLLEKVHIQNCNDLYRLDIYENPKLNELLLKDLATLYQLFVANSEVKVVQIKNAYGQASLTIFGASKDLQGIIKKQRQNCKFYQKEEDSYNY